MDDEPTLTPRGQLRGVIADVAREQRLDPELIYEGHARLPGVQFARAVVAARLFDRGIPPKRIARLMKQREKTVLDYLRKVPPRSEITSEGGSDHGNEQDGTEGSGDARSARGAGRR